MFSCVGNAVSTASDGSPTSVRTWGRRRSF